MKRLLSILLYWNIIYTTQAPQLSDLSNTTILKNKEQTQSILKHFGFKKIYFSTDDQYKLCGLFLDQSKTHPETIKGTLILIAGFYPGTKEGIATFYQMFAHLPYNFFFFDARRHNESEGNLFSYEYIKEYGSHEYKDIVAAVEYLEEYNNHNNINPSIFLLGICSGAFHSIKSIDHLAKTNPQTHQRIKGVIFDSGWSSISEIAEPTISAEIYNRFKNSFLSIVSAPLSWLLIGIYRLLFKSNHQNIESIEKMIQQVECPILFVHSKLDKYAPVEPVQKIASQAKKPSCWWTEDESHATCHLKHQSEYVSQIKNFLDQK